MDTQRQEFRIGIMVLACIVCLVLMTVLFGRRDMMHFGGEEGVLQVRFQRAPGVSRGTPVFKSGVQIGQVSRVELIEEDRFVQVSIRLARGRRVFTDEDVRITQGFVLGDARLEFVKRADFVGPIEEIDPRTHPYLVGVDSLDLMSGFAAIEVDLSRAIQNVAEAAEHLGTFIGRLNDVIGTPEEFQAQQENFSAIIDETRQTMLSMRQTTDGISRIVNDPAVQRNVQNVIADLPGIIDHSRVLVGESTLFVQDARALIEQGQDSLEDLGTGLERVIQTFDVFATIADQIEGDVPEIVAAVRRSTLRLESLFSELTMIVEGIRHADGTVMRLIRDPEAYEALMATLDNVERITDEIDWMLRVDVKPIAHNMKILTDKAARDPAIFIRNLLRREPPIKPMAWCVGSGMVRGAPLRPGAPLPAIRPMRIIDGEVVEILSETPVRVNQIPQHRVSQHQVPQHRIPQHQIPPPSAGRIVNVDPRYANF
jgi:ABC-type transporter Mla subunit MlaD